MSTTKQGLCLPSADVWIGFRINLLAVFKLDHVLNVLNRTNRTRLTNSKHANTNQRTHPDGSGGPLIHYTNASNSVSNHSSLFDFLLSNFDNGSVE